MYLVVGEVGDVGPVDSDPPLADIRQDIFVVVEDARRGPVPGIKSARNRTSTRTWTHQNGFCSGSSTVYSSLDRNRESRTVLACILPQIFCDSAWPNAVK